MKQLCTYVDFQKKKNPVGFHVFIIAFVHLHMWVANKKKTYWLRKAEFCHGCEKKISIIIAEKQFCDKIASLANMLDAVLLSFAQSMCILCLLYTFSIRFCFTNNFA